MRGKQLAEEEAEQQEASASEVEVLTLFLFALDRREGKKKDSKKKVCQVLKAEQRKLRQQLEQQAADAQGDREDAARRLAEAATQV